MYNYQKATETSLNINTSTQGETIEDKINRVVNNKEPITDGAPLIYTERKNGINPAYDVRTDRWEIAIDAMDYVSKTHKAKREDRIKAQEEKDNLRKLKPENPGEQKQE